MINNINPKVRGIILEDLMQELYPNVSILKYKQLMELSKVDRYLTTGLNLCDEENELLIIIPDYLFTNIRKRNINYLSLKLPQEIPDRFIEFLKQNQIAIELIAYIHMSNLLTK